MQHHFCDVLRSVPTRNEVCERLLGCVLERDSLERESRIVPLLEQSVAAAQPYRSSAQPYLIDPNTGMNGMSESKDIIEYLYSKYALWTPPNELLRSVSGIVTPLLAPLEPNPEALGDHLRHLADQQWAGPHGEQRIVLQRSTP